MTDQPQLMTEEIELIPHPMDAWRAALNALIACAPGDSAAIAVHLAEARQQALVFVDRTAATKGTLKLVNRLMLIGAGRIVGDRLQSQAAPATVASLNRRVTARMTVVVNGTDYDVSAMPGVMVGDIIRVDPNNMPPVLNREWGFDLPIPHAGAHQSRLGQVLCCGKIPQQLICQMVHLLHQNRVRLLQVVNPRADLRLQDLATHNPALIQQSAQYQKRLL